jgi:hypothetical protein
MVVKRGPTRGSDYQYCLELFREIPPAWVMAFETEWADRARRHSDGEEGAFPLELIEGYKHMKSVVRNVPQKDFIAVYQNSKNELSPEILDSEQGADYIWNGLFEN